MSAELFSIRMHSSLAGSHLSGAERLGDRRALSALAASLVERALAHERGEADQIRVTVERLDPGALLTGCLPGLMTLRVPDHRQGRQAAAELLRGAGVAPEAISSALSWLLEGPSPEGGNLRGAMLIDAVSGERLEPDRRRGVRVSRMDLAPSLAEELGRALASFDLDNAHVREALVLAGKVLAAPGVVAELCWSDDPSYTAGYVASSGGGYQRLTHLKALGDPRGGRAFFLRPEGLDLPALLAFLEKTPMLFTGLGPLAHPVDWRG